MYANPCICVLSSAGRWRAGRRQGAPPMAQGTQTRAGPPTTEPIARSDASERMRLYRERRRRGLRCVTIQLRETEIDALIRKGLLRAETRNDQSALRKALHAHLDRTL